MSVGDKPLTHHLPAPSNEKTFVCCVDFSDSGTKVFRLSSTSAVLLLLGRSDVKSRTLYRWAEQEQMAQCSILRTKTYFSTHYLNGLDDRSVFRKVCFDSRPGELISVKEKDSSGSTLNRKRRVWLTFPAFTRSVVVCSRNIEYPSASLEVLLDEPCGSEWQRRRGHLCCRNPFANWLP